MLKHDVRERMKNTDDALVLMTKHEDDLGTAVAEELSDSWDRNRLVFESAGWSDAAFPIRLIRHSDSMDPYTRYMEDDNAIRRFCDIAIARRDAEIGMHERPLIEDWSIACGRFWMHQNPVKPLSWMRFGLEPRHPLFDRLLEDCTDEEMRWKFAILQREYAREIRNIQPAQRLLNSLLCDPAFAARCDGENDLHVLLNRGIRFIREGSDRVSENAQRVLTLGTLNALKDAAFRGLNRKVLVVIDEAEASQILDRNFAFMMDEMRGFNVDFWVSTQTMNVTDEVLESLSANCRWIDVGRAGSPKVIDTVGRLFGTAVVDPNVVHWVEERKRQVHDGYEEIETKSTTETVGMSEGGSIGRSFGRSVTQGRNKTLTEGTNKTTGNAKTIGRSVANGKTWGTTDGGSSSQTDSWSKVESESHTEGESDGFTSHRNNTSSTYSRTESDNESTTKTEGGSRTESYSSSRSNGGSHTVTDSESDTKSVSDGTSESKTEGKSVSLGESHGLNQSISQSNSESHGVTRGMQFLSKHREEIDKIPHYLSRDWQIALVQQLAMRLGVGEWLVREGGRVTLRKSKPPKVEKLRGLREVRILALVQRMKSSPYFVKPSLLGTPVDTRGAAWRHGRNDK